MWLLIALAAIALTVVEVTLCLHHHGVMSGLEELERDASSRTASLREALGALEKKIDEAGAFPAGQEIAEGITNLMTYSQEVARGCER